MKLHLDTLLSMTTTFTSMIGLCTRCTGVHWLCELPNSGYVQCCRDFSSIGAAVPLIPLTRPHPALRRPVSMTLGVWFGFVGAALLPAVGTCVVLVFGAMPGR